MNHIGEPVIEVGSNRPPDQSLEETANLPEPEVLAADIFEGLESALEQFRVIAEDLGE